MRALLALKDFPVATQNDIALLLQTAGIEAYFCKNADEIFESSINQDDIIIIPDSEKDFFEKLKKQNLKNFVILIIKSQIHHIAPILKKLQNIQSFVAFQNIDQDPRDIVTLLRKLKTKKIFGIEYYLCYDTPLCEYTVKTPEDKRHAIADVRNFVEKLGKNINSNRFEVYAQRIGELVDELILNAVFHANPRFRNTPYHAQFYLEPQEHIHIRWGFDGVNFALSVSDPFGNLQRDTVIKYLTRDNENFEMTEATSAGIGLQLIFDKVHQFIFNIEPHKKTEIICTLRLEKRLRDFDSRLKSLHFFTL